VAKLKVRALSQATLRIEQSEAKRRHRHEPDNVIDDLFEKSVGIVARPRV
jgi:hypothetical protein